MHSEDRYRFSSRTSLVLASLLGLFVCALALARLSAYGIWDPWELNIADAARKLGGQGDALIEPSRALAIRLVHAAFAAFGTREWAGRLPIAIGGVALLGLTGLWIGALAGARAGLYALIALGTTPFFLFNSKQMIGATPTFALSTLVMLSASLAVFGLKAERANVDVARRALSLLLLLVACIAAILSSGAMLSVVPPLGAVSVAWLLIGPEGRADDTPAQRFSGLLCTGLALAFTLLVARDVWEHAADVSIWIGASPLDNEPPTYERTIEQLFHTFVPWSAVLPVALGTLLRPGDLRRPEARVRIAILAWAALAFAAHTLFISTYGNVPFPAPAALAAAAALWLCDLEDDRQRNLWPEALLVLLMVALVIRDFALYPASPTAGLPITEPKIPDTFNPKIAWALALGGFAFAVTVAATANLEARPLQLRAPYRGLSTLWRKSGGHKVWMGLLVAACVGLLVFGVIAWAAPSVRLTSIARRVGRVIGFIPLALPVCAALIQLFLFVAPKLAFARIWLLLIASIGIGTYASQKYLVDVSELFSPRDVFSTFNRFAKKGEELAQHKVEGRAAAYYAEGTVIDVPSREQLLTFLERPGRRWAAFPADDLADIDVEYRRRSGKHLFVASADNARVALVATQKIEGLGDHNPLAKFVVKTAPKVLHPVNARFEDKVELIGYDVQLPGKDHVGAGQNFIVTWVFRALKGNLGSYKIFLHIDGQDQRLNGDHDPVDGKYPVRLWDEGDVIVDRQVLSVPATYPPGTYTLYIGFFRGESRLQIVEGPKDDANRVAAGKIIVR